MKVAFVFGGDTLEASVSMMSKDDLIQALSSLGHDVYPIEFSHKISSEIEKIAPDIVYNGMYGQYGEDGKLSALLDIMKIPYTHSSPLESAIAFNKKISYNFMDLLGINRPKFIVCKKGDILSGEWKKMILEDEYLKNKEEFFIKPNEDGSSFDSFKATLDSDFSNFNFKTRSKEILVQEFIEGFEVFVPVLENKAIGCIGVKHSGDFYDFKSKYFTGRHEKPKLDIDIEKRILSYAEKLHNEIGLNCISRSDFLITKNNEIFMLEINSQPGMTSVSLFPDVAKEIGISYQNLVKIILESSNGKKE